MEVLRDRNKALICCFSTAGKVNRFSLAAELGCGPDQRSRHLCLPTRLTVWKLACVGGRWSEGLKSMTFSVASDVALPQFPNLICHHFLFSCQIVKKIFILFFFAFLDLVIFFGALLVQWWEHVSRWHTAALLIWFCWSTYFQLHATVCAEMSVAICRATQFWIILVIELRSQFYLYILCTYLQKET